MQVYKFGGASIKDADAIKNVVSIITQHPSGNLLVVISAMGKTTNALELVAKAFYQNKNEEAIALFTQIKNDHNAIALQLLVTALATTQLRLNDLYTEVEWLLHDKPVRTYNYYYDQIVSIGELLSSTLVSAYCSEMGINNTWHDIRDSLRTNNTFRAADVDIAFTTEKVKALQQSVFCNNRVVLTQGFIGCTQENETTTLGREGSDYTAALLSQLLGANSLTIWKDVAGVLNADPKIITNAQLIPQLNYAEIIEMAYYGAQVIHPKTIKPLHNAAIPMYVKCFNNPKLTGTLINNLPSINLPSIIVHQYNQVLITIRTADYSFINGAATTSINHLLIQCNILPTLTQLGALAMSICVHDDEEKINQFTSLLAALFEVSITRNLLLITIRHHNKVNINVLINTKNCLLQQITPTTYQGLLAQ